MKEKYQGGKLIRLYLCELISLIAQTWQWWPGQLSWTLLSFESKEENLGHHWQLGAIESINNKIKLFVSRTILLSVPILVLVITLTEFIQIKYLEKNDLHKCLVQCFSAIDTSRIIFTIRENEQYKFLDGLRVIMAFGVIMCHNFVAQLSVTSTYSDDFLWLRRPLYNPDVCIDGFMLVSGKIDLLALFYLIKIY